MKKILFFSALMGMSFTMFAQQVANLNLRRVDKKTVPIQVTGAAERDFPDGSVSTYFSVPAQYTKEDWLVTSNGATKPGSNPDYYSVSVEKNGDTYYALYNKSGQKIASQVKVKDVPLPDNIVTSIQKAYPGYTIESDKYTRLVSETTKKSYFRVTVKKGSTLKKLFFNTDGTPVK
ncbi:hypothetical protein [Chitinophaga arvensicola]|uniref:Beta-lactamase-inhibitor-like, PepSY-like n=1 Tax=Chitinophaga arvensicola TaxID=29529 RepID=A0A1I0S5W2_9BACT|nr:hypothetical protein [Chitinophaga arvensicola]SEW50660.1 hypothetical protein SAMN04488122_3912 [Chitinophaga arvensicola]